MQYRKITIFTILKDVAFKILDKIWIFYSNLKFSRILKVLNIWNFSMFHWCFSQFASSAFDTKHWTLSIIKIEQHRMLSLFKFVAKVEAQFFFFFSLRDVITAFQPFWMTLKMIMRVNYNYEWELRPSWKIPMLNENISQLIRKTLDRLLFQLVKVHYGNNFVKLLSLS